MNKFFYISLILGLITYLIVLAYIYLFQRNLLYHPSVNGYQGDKINFDYEEVFIKNNEGIKLSKNNLVSSNKIICLPIKKVINKVKK